MLEIGGVPLQPQELLRRKRQGGELADAEIAALVAGIADGRLGDAQVGAFAMAVCTRGMDARVYSAMSSLPPSCRPGPRCRWTTTRPPR